MYHLVAVVAAVLVVVLRLLEVVFSLAAEHCTCYGAQNTMAAHLVTAKVSGSTATKSTHKSSVALLLHSWVTGTVLLLTRLAVGVLALWVLVLAVRTLLRELILRLRGGVTSLLVLTILPLLLLVAVVTVLACLLTMLEATLRRRTVLRIVTLLVTVSLLTILLLRLLVTLLLVAALVIATLLRVGAVALGRVLLLLTVALVVLIVSRHFIVV